MGAWNRITVCSKKRPEGGYTGNSFWLTFLEQSFYLGTWGGMLYRLPDGSRITELCVDWLTRESSKVLNDFNEALKLEYNLLEVTEDEFSRITQRTR